MVRHARPGLSWHARARRGKTVPEYHASMDMGAYVVVLNAEKVVVSGNKFETKMYRRHTGRPGSLKEETFKKLQAVRPCFRVSCAPKGVLRGGSTCVLCTPCAAAGLRWWCSAARRDFLF